MSNSGIVTGATIELDLMRLAKYTGGKNALVAQGGGQRGIFTSGVLDAFLLSNFDPFDVFMALLLERLTCVAFFVARSVGRAFILDLTTDPMFFNLFRYIRRKQHLGIDWAVDKISDYPYKLDIDMGRKVLADRKAFAAVTDTSRLFDHYLPMLQDDWRKVMIATCAIPRLYNQAVEFEHGIYVDGGKCRRPFRFKKLGVKRLVASL